MDPLAQLKDIHLPEQIHNYPLAPGWWILAFILIAITIWLTAKWVKLYRLAKAKRQAIKLLSYVDDDEENQNNDIMDILKWSALQYFPREQVAPLFGADLQLFLKSNLPEKFQHEFIDLSQPAFEHRYQINELAIQDRTFKKAALLWLNHALPPKEKKQKNTIENNTETDNVLPETTNDDINKEHNLVTEAAK